MHFGNLGGTLCVVFGMHVRTGAVVLLLATSGCPSAPDSTASVEPAKAEVASVPEPKQETALEPEPEPELEPEPQPEPSPSRASWGVVADREYVASHRLSGSETRASYALEGEGLRYAVELVVREESATVRLTEHDSGHTLEQAWSTSNCAFDFYDGDSAGAGIAERARDERGRKLLELWISCSSGEDIRQVDSLVMLVLSDAAGLSLLWSGETASHGSHVCAQWSDIEVDIEPPDIVLREFDRAEIFEPESIPYYDCEDAKQYEHARGEQRLALP